MYPFSDQEPYIHYYLPTYIHLLSKYIVQTYQHSRFQYFLSFYVYVVALPSFFLNFSPPLYFNLTKYKAFCSRNLKYLMLLWLQKIGPAPLNLESAFTIAFSEMWGPKCFCTCWRHNFAFQASWTRWSSRYMPSPKKNLK